MAIQKASAPPTDPCGYHGENRLIEITRADTTVISYSYDAQSRRISKQISSGTAHYVYDGWNLIAEYTGTTHSSSYTWGMDLSGSMQGAGGVGGLLAVNDGSATYYPTYDGNGNVSEYLDSTGTVQAHYEYDAFGNTTVSTGCKVKDFSHRFSTKPLDAETGFYYYVFRYYDPVTGRWRWPSRDPIGEKGGVNVYGFVGNNGANRTDYLGLMLITPPSNREEIDERGRQMWNDDGVFWLEVRREKIPSSGVIRKTGLLEASRIEDWYYTYKEDEKCGCFHYKADQVKIGYYGVYMEKVFFEIASLSHHRSELATGGSAGAFGISYQGASKGSGTRWRRSDCGWCSFS